MVHPIHSPDERLLPKIWVQRLLSQFQAELWQLNAQLTLPPIPGSDFVFGVSPRPLAKPRVPRTFQRALDLGRAPDIGTFAEPEIDGRRYNLYRRVATHVPYSEDWLFQPLKAYLAPQLPGIEYSVALIARCLQRLGLRRLSRHAAAYGVASGGPRWQEVVIAMQRAIVHCPAPLHLELLVALYHERQWCYPDTAESVQYRALCLEAASRFARRPEFARALADVTLQREIEGLFRRVLTRIAIDGHRSPRPVVEALAVDDPQWRHDAPSEWWGPPVFVACEAFEGFPDADLTLALRDVWLIPHVLQGKPTRYCTDLLPFEDEARVALEDVLGAVPICAERWHEYARDPVFADTDAGHTDGGNSPQLGQSVELA